jgi:Raf kinase inhibitor-like YbhB/YbcL family protein
MRARLLALSVLLALTGCGGDEGEHASAADPHVSRTISVSSPAFGQGKQIPSTYTCRGAGRVPDLAWSRVPDEARNAGSVALVVDDPDAPDGGYVHWVVVGIPASVDGIESGDLPAGAREVDASGGPGWTPPCPPSGTHHYRFTVYAFPSDRTLAWSKDTPLADVLALLAKESIAWGRLTGTVTASGGDSGGGY